MDTLCKKKRAWLVVAAMVALIALAAAACGDDDDDGATPGLDSGIDYDSLDGNIDIDGSSTVYPITQAMAEEFLAVSDVEVRVGLSGTGGGFEKFCRGETQLSDASRPMNAKEKDELCKAAGITDIVELQVAIDALTVVVHPDNDWATCMTPAQIQNIFKSDGAETWKDVDPSWPDEEIVLYYPGADSGTFDYFKEAIKLRGTNNEPNHRSDGTSSEDDNVLVNGVEDDENAIGYFGFAYYQEAGQDLTAVQVDGGSGCVEPTRENALAGKYKPLSRPLFIYTRESFLKEKPEILGFVSFYFEVLDEIVEEVGYITLPDELKAEQVAKFSAYLPE